MERKLPNIMVGGDRYIVDLRAGELRSINNNDKTLQLFKMNWQSVNKLSFWYDKKAQTIVPSKDGDSIELVNLSLNTLDRQFNKELRRNVREEKELIAQGKSIYNQEGGIHATMPIQGNKARMLPMIELYGTDFFLDLRTHQLREVDRPGNVIKWENLVEEENFHFTLWYDAKTKNAFNGTLDQAKGSNDVKTLTLPPLDIMIREGIKRHEEKVFGVKHPVDLKPELKQVLRTRIKKGRGI